MATQLLKQQLVSLGIDINRQIDVVVAAAKEQQTSPHDLRHADGSWVLTNLLLAKAQVLNGLAALEVRKH
jgi:hypothetical protein